MIFSCIPLSDAVLHETGQRRQDIDRRVNGLAIQRTIQNDLSLGDISGQVGDRMGDVIVGHGENRQLRHRAFHSPHDTCTLIDGRQLAVKITRKTFPARDFSLGGGYLTHGLSKGSHIRQNNKYMHMLLKGQIFRHGQRHLRSDETLHHRIVGQIQEHGHVVGHAALLKGMPEEVRHVMLDAHGGKNDGKLLIRVLAQRRLFYNLGGQLIMWQTVAGENRQLLSADQRCQSVDGGDSGVNIVSRVLTADRI